MFLSHTRTRTHSHTRTHAHTHTRTHAHTHTRTHAHTHTLTHLHTPAPPTPLVFAFLLFFPPYRRRQAAKEAESLTEREEMAKNRASLPIFPYRGDLISAVEDHQVVVIVGETVGLYKFNPVYP
jgi:HrpA-like RNA helicase